MDHPIVKVAIVQAAPVLFDKASAQRKIAEMTTEAAAQGAQLVVFPEAFLSGYPRGLSFGVRVGSRSPEGRKDWLRFWDSAVTLPGPETELLGELASENGVLLVIGVVERDHGMRSGTLYNTTVYIGPDGRLLGKHRKLMPTGAERLLWGQGDGSTLSAFETPLGRLGGLICWENYMPLARTAMYAQGVDLYIAPTADARETWQATIRHIACEGRCFVLSANQYATKASYPADLASCGDIAEMDEVLCRGGSAIVGPLGDYIAGPLYDEEGILTATLDLQEIIRSRFDFDVVGHYSRPDIFQLLIDGQPHKGVVTTKAPPRR